MSRRRNPIVEWDVDEAASLSSRSGDDTVYWQVAGLETYKGQRLVKLAWYVTVVIDSETGSFVETGCSAETHV